MGKFKTMVVLLDDMNYYTFNQGTIEGLNLTQQSINVYFTDKKVNEVEAYLFGCGVSADTFMVVNVSKSFKEYSNIYKNS